MSFLTAARPCRSGCLLRSPLWRGGNRRCCFRGVLVIVLLLIPAGQVGMIMVGFVPILGYKSSKNLSGRPDLNRRPLGPEECTPIPATRSFPCFRR
jgi:hypothetical protein